MEVTLEDNGDGTSTVRFSFTAATFRLITTLKNACHYLYPKVFGDLYDEDGVLIPFDNLTNAQIAGVLARWIRKMMIDLSMQYIGIRVRAEGDETIKTEADETLI